MSVESATLPVAPEEESAAARFLEGFGAPFVFVGREIHGLVMTFVLTSYYALFRPIRWREVVRQMYEMGNRSLFFVIVVMGFFGLIMIMQTAIQSEKILGDLSMIGALFLQLLLREFGPTITASMIAIRVGTGLAAEVGSMVVTEQVDALRMNDAEPLQYLIVPRMLGCIVMTFVLTCVASLASYLASVAGAYFIFDLNPHTFHNTSLIVTGDLITFVLKTMAYGFIVPVIGCHAGLSAYGGSEGVGLATTRAVVNGTLGITLTDFVLTALGYAFIY